MSARLLINMRQSELMLNRRLSERISSFRRRLRNMHLLISEQGGGYLS
ncbi:hypothetical protein ENTCAN_05920 [Enterobacter cancerogenus ATCC 35316]|nr:hypothetical protein ENTCAN_05920 [Enterobacter cancerogenus ATCC 35316]